MEKKEILKRDIPYQQMKPHFPCIEDKMSLETKLDIEKAEIEKTPNLPQIVNFRQGVRIKTVTTAIKLDIHEIHMSKFETLYLDALTPYSANDDHITAVKIWHGLDEGLNWKPLFQPIYIKKNNGVYKVIDSPNIFHFDGVEFLPYTSVDDVRLRYRNSIEIIHSGEAAYDDFRQCIDTEAVIYPFQTIYTLLYDNISANNCVTLSNSIATDRISGVLNNKHSILLYTTKSPDKKFQDFKNKYANRSHLCPPGCAVITDPDLY